MARVGHFLTHREHPPHFVVEIFLRSRAYLLNNPKNAPLGQMYWHQNLRSQ
jgi:hypothetical protein